MAVGIIMSKVCKGLKNIPMKVLCILLLGLQSVIQNAVIILYYGKPTEAEEDYVCEHCYYWIVGDLVVVALFIASFVITYRDLNYYESFKTWNVAHVTTGLPLASLAWFVYAALVSSRLIVIFKTDIQDKLDEENFFGPQLLKTSVTFVAVVFVLFAASQHRGGETSLEKAYINALTGSVTVDLLDTVDFLDILYVKETDLLLPFPLENAIIAIAIINVLRPTFSLVVLFLKHLEKRKISRELAAGNVLIYILLVNLPFMVCRMYIWHNLDHDTSVFLVKNFIFIFIGLHELYEIGLDKGKERGSDIEMYPRNLKVAHRPSDLIDGASKGSDAAGSDPEAPSESTPALVERCKEDESEQ